MCNEKKHFTTNACKLKTNRQNKVHMVEIQLENSELYFRHDVRF